MRILIADDHEIIRQGLRTLLSTDDTWAICGEAVDGREAVEKARLLKPDIIVMDISMPNMDGLQATRTIRETSPEIEIVILSQHDSKEMIRQAFKAGARGYVVKSAISNDLVTALRTVGRHEAFSAEQSAPRGRLPMAGPQEILLKEAALERALRESEERFRWTFEQAAVGMVHANSNGQLLRVNQRLCHILGYAREEILKFRLWDLTHPDDLAATLENMQKLRSGELDSFTLLKRYIRKDGGIVWATATLNLIRGSRDVPEYIMGVIYDVTAQKNAETALNTSIAETMMRLELAQYELRQKEEQLRVALAASDTATFRWSPDTGELLEFGDEAKRLFGFAAQESVTNTEQLLGHVHPDDVATVIAAGERCTLGHDLEIENRVILPEGEVRWLFARGKVSRDANGRTWIVGVATDITKRKEAEAAARWSDANRQFALQAARVAEWELEIPTEKVKRSLLHDQIFGYESLQPNWTVDRFLEHVHPEDRESVHTIIQRSAAGGSDLDYECRIIRPDQGERWVWAHGARMPDELGKPSRMIGITMDITDRKKTEEALRKSVFRFQRFVESNVIGIVIADATRIIEANDVFLDILDYSREELVAGNLNWMTMTPAEHLPRDIRAIEELKTLGACSPFEKDMIRKDGSHVPILIGASVLNPAPLEWMCFVLDLSELKQVERELREARDDLEHRVEIRTYELVKTLSSLQTEVKVRKEAEEKMRELSGRLLRLQDDERRKIARELHDTTGQTLSALRMSSDALKRCGEMPPKARKYCEDIDALAEEALNEIRTTSHLLHPPLLDEIGFASAARWFVEGLAQRSRIEIDAEIQIGDRLPALLELTLFRVLQESLTNIHRHSGSSTASIRCEKANGDVVLRIQDSGKGIAREVLERFKRDGVGTGVGLAGMRERIRELGGNLEIESGAQGTRLTVSIPIPASQAPGPA
jgi:PAS domain S-box-containing protein